MPASGTATTAAVTARAPVRSSQTLQIRGDRGPVRVAELDLGHEVPGFDALRIADPAFEFGPRVLQRSCGERGPLAEVGEIGTELTRCLRAANRVASRARFAHE